MRPLKPTRRLIPFSVFRKMKPDELKAIGAKVKPPLYLRPSDVKPKPSEAPVYYEHHEAEANAEAPAIAPTKRLMGFREWCEKQTSPKV